MRLPGLDGVGVAVTGGASGMGLAIAILAARSGARVVVGDRNVAALADVQQCAARDGLSIHCVRLDVTDASSAAAFVAEANAEGSLAGVVCAAGIAPDMPVLEMSLDLWNEVLAVNLTGTFLVAQAAARAMVERGEGGSIVNVSGGNAMTGAVNLAHYTASKAGVIALTKTMARELGAHGIRVNNVAPGAINTPLYWSRLTEQESDEFVARIPITRIGEPEDIAHCIGFLLSDLSPWITGQTVCVNGGMLMP